MRRGYTLIEVLVASLIFSLLLGSVTMAFAASGKLMGWVTARSSAGSDALLSLRRFSREFQASAWGSVTINNGNQISFQVQGPTVGTSFQPVPQFVVYYFDGVGTLYRKYWDNTNPPESQLPSLFPPDPLGVGRLDSAQLTWLATNPNGSELPIAHGITQFSLTPATYPTTTAANVLTIQLQVQEPVVGQTTIVQQTVQTSVAPRNMKITATPPPPPPP